MKYLLGCALLLIILCLLLLGGDQKAGSAMDTRGDKQFSFSNNQASEYGEPSRDNLGLPTAPPSGTPQEGDQAANTSSADETGGNGRPETRMNGEQPESSALQDSETALKNGQSAGQVSNVPGTTTTSPNGTANPYGTGGIPLFPPELPPDSSQTGTGNNEGALGHR